MDSGLQVLDSSFCEWDLDSGFQSLVGLRIPCVIFRIPKPKIPDSTSKTFPDFGFHKHIFPGFRNPLHESSLRVTLGTYIVREPSAEKWQIEVENATNDFLKALLVWMTKMYHSGIHKKISRIWDPDSPTWNEV